MKLTDLILIIAILIVLIIAVPTILDNHKTLRRLERKSNKKD